MWQNEPSFPRPGTIACLTLHPYPLPGFPSFPRPKPRQELGAAKLLKQQACYLPCTDDGLPVIGRVPGLENAYVATGKLTAGARRDMPTLIVGLLLAWQPAMPALPASSPPLRLSRPACSKPACNLTCSRLPTPPLPRTPTLQPRRTCRACRPLLLGHPQRPGHRRGSSRAGG